MARTRKAQPKPARGFGLPSPQPMTLAEVDDVLGQMKDQTAQVYANVADRIDDDLTDMAAGLQSVRMKVSNGILGHLRQLNGQVNTVSDRLGADIDGELQWLDGTVKHVEKAAAQPRRPRIPQAQMPTPAGRGMKLYTVLASPDCSEWRAVPGDLGDWYSQQWAPPEGWTVQGVVQASPATVQAVLDAWVGQRGCIPTSHSVPT